MPHQNQGKALTDEVYAEILAAIHSGDGRIAPMLAQLHPSDISALLERLPLDLRHDTVPHIPQEYMGDILAHLSDGVRESLFEDFTQDEIVEALSKLESDDVADIVRDMPEQQAEETIEAIFHEKQELLTFSEDSAGGIMQLEFVAMPKSRTVGKALEYMRKNQQKLPQDIHVIYITNNHKKMLGSVAVSRLVTMPLEAKLGDIMWQDAVTVTPQMDREEVAHLFEKYDLYSCAVVDKERHILGVITIDDILDVIVEEHEEDIMRAAGLAEGEDLFAPMLKTTRKRLPWLLVNLATAVLASFVIAQFEAEISQLVALAVLMPIVASMGGNAGTQTLTIVVRGLGMHKITMKNALVLLKKEFLVGGFNGMLLAFLLAGGTIAIYDNVMLGAVICVATIINHFLAAVAGLIIPLTLERLGKDPAVSSGVLLTTITDVGGFFVFLGLAALFL